MTFAFLRFFISALIILPFTMHKLRLQRSDIYALLFIAIIATALRIAYTLYGLTLAPSINGSIIGSIAPVLLLIGSIFLFHEKTNKKIIQGTILSFVGILLIVLQPITQQGFDSSLIGNIFFIISVVLGVLYIFLLKDLSSRYSPLALLFWIFAIASITLFPFAFTEIKQTGFSPILDTRGLIGVTFATLFATCLAYSLQTYGMQHITTGEVGLFSYIDPFVTVLIAMPLLGEQVTGVFLIGSTLIFLGIFIAEGRIHYHPVHLLKQKPALSEEKSYG